MLKPEDKIAVKRLLSAVMTDDVLAAEFNRASTEKLVEVQDYRVAMLGAYAGVLKEIMTERATPRARNASKMRVGPDIEAMRKKFGVKK